MTTYEVSLDISILEYEKVTVDATDVDHAEEQAIDLVSEMYGYDGVLIGVNNIREVAV